MLDPAELISKEGRDMGRGVKLVNASAILSGPIEVMTLLYNCDPIDVREVGPMYEQRVAVVVAEDGKVTQHTSLVAQTRFKGRE